MSERHETIADIIAEMRALSNTISDGIIAIDGRSIADRLEAAHRRERGNSAALREACELMLLFDASEEAAENDGLSYQELIAEYADHIDECQKKANAALAAPPRNCDVYNSESCRMAYHLHGDGLMTMQAFADWLFAPATKKEGGNNAD